MLQKELPRTETTLEKQNNHFLECIGLIGIFLVLSFLTGYFWWENVYIGGIMSITFMTLAMVTIWAINIIDCTK